MSDNYYFLMTCKCESVIKNYRKKRWVDDDLFMYLNVRLTVELACVVPAQEVQVFKHLLNYTHISNKKINIWPEIFMTNHASNSFNQHQQQTS